MSAARNLIVVDTETTGLHDGAAILEIAAINLATGDEYTFVPNVTKEQLAKAEPYALQLNRYYERGIWKQALSPSDTRQAYARLSDMLQSNTFGGSNPSFDSKLLSRMCETTWHHRLADLANYAAPWLGRSPDNLPGLADVCAYLGVENEDQHSALSDARVTAECFRRLIRDYNE